MVSGPGGIGGPGSGGKVGGPSAPSPSPSRAVEGRSFGETIDAARPLEATSKTAPLDRLRAGEIDAHRYAELRVNEATAHLEGLLPPGEIEKIRAELHDLIENDPDVAALVKAAETGS